jgi:hypothetical protein
MHTRTQDVAKRLALDAQPSLCGKFKLRVPLVTLRLGVSDN